MASPSPEIMHRYADSLAWQQLVASSIDPFGRQITAAFGPTARNNIDALQSWIYCRLLEKGPSSWDFSVDSDLAMEIGDLVRDRIEEVFAN